MIVASEEEISPSVGDPRNANQGSNRRVVWSHFAVWLALALAPFTASVGYYLGSQLLSGGSDDLAEMAVSVLWIAMFLLVPVVLTVSVLAAIDVGFLLAAGRFTGWARWLRAAIPAVAAFVVAMAVFSAYIAMTMFDLNGTSRYYAVAAVGAAVLSGSVFASHMWHYRSQV